MDLAAIGSIGELVGALAVIASLLYVGRQVKGSAVATRSGVHQAAAANSSALLMRTADPELFDLRVAANTDYDALSDGERTRVDNLYMALFNYWEALYYDHAHGAVHADVWEGRVRRMHYVFEGHAAASRVWRQHSAMFGTAFSGFVDAEVLAGADRD